MVQKTMTDKEFLSLSDESRSEYVASITDEEQALTSKKLAEYDAGRPVHYEDPETGLFRTIQWDKILNYFSFDMSMLPQHILQSLYIMQQGHWIQ